ncbi:NAD(P)H-binding protein [Modestobacter sp. URMC 112]
MGRLLTARGDTVLGVVRDPAQRDDLTADGVDPVVLDLERVKAEAVATMPSMGVESVAGGATPEGMDEVFVAYLRAKPAAEEDLLARAALDLTVLRPGGLTDEPGTGRVRPARHVPRGEVPRDDVAAALVALLDRPGGGAVVELVGGDTPIGDPVAALTSPR